MVIYRYILELIARTADKNYFKDAHPDAVACRLRLTLLCIAARTVQPWDAQEDLGGDKRAGMPYSLPLWELLLVIECAMMVDR